MKRLFQIAILVALSIAIFGNPCFAAEGTKVSAKTGVTSAPAHDDVLYIVDTSANEGKKIETQYFKMDASSSYVVPLSVSDLTLDFSKATIHLVTMDTEENVDMTFSNLPSGTGARVYTIRFKNASGSATVNFPAGTKWAGGTVVDLTTGTSNAVDIFRFIYGMNSTDVEIISVNQDMQ
jgi:hypothetical protein